MPELENQSEISYNRNEIKCRKALTKAGMKPENNINRITLKKKDGLIFVIEKPEVLSNGNTFAIFGELKIADMNANIKESAKFAGIKKATPSRLQTIPEDEGSPLSESGLTPSHITMVMDHADCSRNKAIQVLRKTNDDMV